MKWIRSLFLEECRSPECVEMELNVVHMRCLGKAWLPSLRGWGDTRRGGKPCFSLWGLGTKEGLQGEWKRDLPGPSCRGALSGSP